MVTIVHRAGAFLAVVLLALAGLVGLAGQAKAANFSTVSGDNSEPCRIDWTAAALNDWDLQDSDTVTWDGVTHTRLMTDIDGQPVFPYQPSNGGYLREVGPRLGTEGGFLQMQHWYAPRAGATTRGVNWRIPVANATATEHGAITVTLPAGTVVTSVSDKTSYFGNGLVPVFAQQFSFTTPEPWVANGGAPVYSRTTLPDGRVQLSIDVGDREARSAFGLEINGTVPNGQETRNDQIGVARYVATIPEGTATCPAVENGDRSSAPCEIDWRTDATTHINGAIVGGIDVHRDEAVTQGDWDPDRPDSLGRLRIDGWTRVNQPTAGQATAFGRIILAAYRPFENGVLEITLDSRIKNPVFTETAPVPRQFTDNQLYGQPMTILSETADATTKTYRVQSGGTLIRNSLMVSYQGDVTDTHAINADYRNTATFTADWVPHEDNALCPLESDLSVDKSVRDSQAPFGEVTEGEEITYTFTVRNTGNQPLTDVTISDENLSDEPIACAATLAPGAQASCTATYTVTAEDIEAGGVTNTATASGTGHDGVVTSEADSVRIPADCGCEDGSGSLGSLGAIAAGSLGSLDPESGSAGSAGEGSLGQSLEQLLTGSTGSAALPLLGSLGSTGTGGVSGSLEELLAGSTAAGGLTGSVEELVTGSAPLLGSAGSAAGSLPAAGSSAGSLALGAIAVGAIALGDSVSKGAFPLPPLPPLPALPTGSLPGGLPPLPFPLPGQPAQQAPQQGAPGAVPNAPGPVSPNGRG